MEYTNKEGFPKYVVDWLADDSYDYDDNTISATTIMNPVRVWFLTKKFDSEIEMDYSDLIASRYGTALHDSVENAKIEGTIQEKRMYTMVEGKRISGKFDMMVKLDNNKFKLVDIKSTSVWGYIFDKKNEDYIKQLSIYRFLGVMNGYDVIDDAEIFMMFTDWQKSKTLQGGDYPSTRVKIKKLKLWSMEKTEEFLKERVNLFKKATDDKLDECTDEELWKKDDVYAVMKKGRKSAVSLETSEEDATNVMNWNKDKKKDDVYYIEKRNGKVGRCAYCRCSEFCEQYKGLRKEGFTD